MSERMGAQGDGDIPRGPPQEEHLEPTAASDGRVSNGPPDIIQCLIPVDLVNSVSRPHVTSLEHVHAPGFAPPPAPPEGPPPGPPADLIDRLERRTGPLQPVDIVDSLPSNIQNEKGSPVENGEAVGNTTNGHHGDTADARWFSRGSGGSSVSRGITMPTDKDSQFYNMNHRRRGKAYIFNHMFFDPKLQLKERNGTNNDRDNLRVTLRQLDFDVEVHNDLPYKEIERILEQASMEDYSDADCIFVAVLSHGELGILYAADHPYKPDNLWSPFTADKVPTLAGKPKLFFIQACQGDRLDSGVQMVARTESDAGPVSYKIPSHADFLIGYSTVPGFYSWRNTTAGSWFIQAFCHVVQREGHSRDLLSILTKVCRKVAFDFQSNVPGDYIMHEKKQIPCITTMLTRDLVFNRK